MKKDGKKIEKEQTTLNPASPQDRGTDDERRLFYVALTRAKESVTITYAREDAERRETLPSAFIDEIKSELVEQLSTEKSEEKFKEDRGFQFQSTSPQPSPYQGEGENQNKAFVQELFDKQGLSPTALNNYLECPWKYFYQNLIRIPSAPTIHQAYGIAVHASLQDLFSILKKEDKGKSFLLDSFEGHLNRQFVSERDRASLLEKGKKSLGGWYDTYSDSWNINVLTEMRINGISLSLDTGLRRYDTGEINDVRLTGVLDKVEFIEDNIVNVVDYKTGKPKTRNDVMGNTKSSNGNYYRQLVFYKLLLTHFNDGAYSMQSGTIDFIEPDEKENYHKETFEISDEEVSELTTIIQRVAGEILSLAFWDKTCDEKDCEFCGLRKLMRVSSR